MGNWQKFTRRHFYLSHFSHRHFLRFFSAAIFCLAPSSDLRGRNLGHFGDLKKYHAFLFTEEKISQPEMDLVTSPRGSAVISAIIKVMTS
jgi:hypothetical protein